jgi:hypothetical protein
MRKGFLIYEKMRKYLVRTRLVIYDFATALFWVSLQIYEENFVFLFDQCSLLETYVRVEILLLFQVGFESKTAGSNLISLSQIKNYAHDRGGPTAS